MAGLYWKYVACAGRKLLMETKIQDKLRCTTRAAELSIPTQTVQVVGGNGSRNNTLVNNGRKNVLPFWMFRDARPLDRVGRVFVTATESSLRAPLPAAVGNFHFTGALSTHHHTRTCSVQLTRIRWPFWILHSLRSYVYRSA